MYYIFFDKFSTILVTSLQMQKDDFSMLPKSSRYRLNSDFNLF